MIGYHFLHTAIEDHSRLAYTEIPTDEKYATAAGFWARANAYFTSVGIAVERVLTHNGSCYRSGMFRDALGTRSAWTRSTHGSTTTITTDATPHSAANSQRPASPTSQVGTPRAVW